MRIAIACGGSGGHIYPGLTLAETLRRLHPSLEVGFVAARKPIDRKLFEGKPYRIHYLIPCPMPESRALSWIPFLVKFTAAFFQATWFQLTFRPQLLVAFGGYVSGPALLSGILFRKPTLLHEENLVPGRASRLLASRVTRMSLGFRESTRYLRTNLPLIYTGPIVRSDLKPCSRKEARTFFGFAEEGKMILVMGGSQGSRRVNTLFLEAMTHLKGREDSLQVLHLAGQGEARQVEEAYRQLPIRARVYPYLEAMSEAYSAADLVVGRGGAMTIAELIFFRKPSILIPLALARGHQRQNIEALVKEGAAFLLEDGSASVESLASLLRRLLTDEALRASVENRLQSLQTDVASRHLASEVLKLLN